MGPAVLKRLEAHTVLRATRQSHSHPHSHTHVLVLTRTHVAGPRAAHPPLAGTPLAAAQANLTAFVVRETVKRETARSKNDLESYIIATRESLESDDVIAVSAAVAFAASCSEGIGDLRALRMI